MTYKSNWLGCISLCVGIALIAILVMSQVSFAAEGTGQSGGVHVTPHASNTVTWDEDLSLSYTGTCECDEPHGLRWTDYPTGMTTGTNGSAITLTGRPNCGDWLVRAACNGTGFDHGYDGISLIVKPSVDIKGLGEAPNCVIGVGQTLAAIVEYAPGGSAPVTPCTRVFDEVQGTGEISIDYQGNVTGVEAGTATLNVQYVKNGQEDTDSFSVIVTEEYVVVDWNSHPGATLVLNNGESEDYIWGDESWSTFLPVEAGVWTQTGTNTGSDPVDSLWDDYEPVVANTGANTVTLGYTMKGTPSYYICDSISFQVAEEASGVLSSGPTPVELLPALIHEFGPSGIDIPRSGEITNNVSASWSKTETTSRTTSIEGTYGQSSSATVGCTVGVLSAAISGGSYWNVKVAQAVTNATSKTLAGSQTFGVGTTFGPVTQEAGDRWRWWSYVAADTYVVNVTYYPDSNPRDGFPDNGSTASVETVTQYVPLAMGDKIEVIPASP